MKQADVKDKIPSQSTVVTKLPFPTVQAAREKEWSRVPLGNGAYARILVNEDLSDTQIEKLRIVLDAMKEGEDKSD